MVYVSRIKEKKGVDGRNLNEKEKGGKEEKVVEGEEERAGGGELLFRIFESSRSWLGA